MVYRAVLSNTVVAGCMRRFKHLKYGLSEFRSPISVKYTPDSKNLVWKNAKYLISNWFIDFKGKSFFLDIELNTMYY